MARVIVAVGTVMWQDECRQLMPKGMSVERDRAVISLKVEGDGYAAHYRMDAKTASLLREALDYLLRGGRA